MQLVAVSTVTIFFVGFVVVLAPTATLAFCSPRHLNSSPSRRQELCSLAEPVDEKREQQETPILLVSQASSSSISSNAILSTELWLDLRGTAMTPQTAIAYLEQNLEANSDVITFEHQNDEDDSTTTAMMQLDGIIVPEEYRGQLGDAATVNSQKIVFSNQLRLSSTKSIDDTMGQVMMARPNHLLNPMDVMQVLTNLPWAVIEKSDDTDDSAFCEEIRNLFSVILSIPSEHGGGTAVSCSNRFILVEVAKIIALNQSHNIGIKTTTTTSTGILLPDDDWILDEGSTDDKTSSKAQKIAVILPLDPALWRIAQDFF